jgi:hypothetical protein
MNRRYFLRSVAASPIVYAIAARTTTIRAGGGFLNSASAATYSFNASAFREGLREAGFVEGQNASIIAGQRTTTGACLRWRWS